jgi:branched-chain amino acid transport system substrate-binding protein
VVTLAALALSASVRTVSAATRRTLKIGSTFDSSGVEQANGTGCFQGAQACFAAINRAGGLHGASLELVPADDQFMPERARANALAFRADRAVVAMLTPLGTRQTAAVMEAVTDIAIVGPNTGTTVLRRSSPPNVFWVRASYDEEVEKLIDTASALGTRRIGLVYPDDPLGRSVLAAFERSMKAHGLTAAVLASTPGTTSRAVEPAAEAVAAAAPQMVIMALAGVAPLFVHALRKVSGGQTAIYGLSIGASTTNIKAMGEVARGVGFALIVPSPFTSKHEIVRRYQADMQSAGQSAFSLPSLEGYINARVCAEGLLRAGPGVTRESLIAALEGIEALDLGGMRIDYGRGNRIGGHYVDVAVIGADGRLLS